MHPKNWPAGLRDMLRSGTYTQQDPAPPEGGKARTSQTQSGTGATTTPSKKSGGQKNDKRQKKKGGNASGGSNKQTPGPKADKEGKPSPTARPSTPPPETEKGNA